jgi:hypothetical protein
MLTNRFWNSTTVLLCALLLQNCQSNSAGIIDTDAAEEPTASSPPSASAVCQWAPSEPLAMRPLTLLTSTPPAAHFALSRLSTTLANEETLSTALSSRSLSPSVLATMSDYPTALYKLPVAAMPGVSHALPLGNKPGVFSPVFTTSSGERVRFGQVDGQWRAAVQADYGGTALQCALPVVGPADVGSFLSWLCSQDKWTSRARIHILEMPQTLYGLCVYLGKAGLLGGVPASPGQKVGQSSSTAPQEEWIQGPTMILSGNQSRTEVFHIPSGYCYKGYRFKPSLVEEQASYTVRYVEGNSKDEIDRREGSNEGSAIDARLSADLAQVVTLSTVGEGMQHAQIQSHQGSHRSSFTHAALVVYGNTQQERLGRRGRLELALEILVARDAALASDSFSIPPSSGDHGSRANQAQLVAQEELQSKIDALSSKCEAMQKAHDERIGNIEKEWSAKLLAVRQEKKALERGYKEIFKQQQASQQATQSSLRALIADLSIRQAVEQQQLQVLLAPEETFGAFAWQHYYGEVGEEPALPDDIEATLNAPCPFWPERQVKDTHLLVLIPATVDGVPFTLNLLRRLIQCPKNGGHKTQYCRYESDVREQLGTTSPAASYWLLMTRDVLPESRDKSYRDQKKLIATHASRTSLPYEMPETLEAATAILTHYVRNGERLYSNNPKTYTCCQESVDFEYQGEEYSGPAAVGEFESSGLHVDHDYYDYDGYGVSGCRKF